MSQWNPIPGETPITDISGLIPRDVKTRQQLNAVEAENIRKVVVKYLARKPSRRQAPFDLRWSLRLHREMFGDVWRWAGVVRSGELNIGVPAFRIETDLQSLLDDLNFWRNKKSLPIVEQAARLHHRAVFIHPFENGNGRWARMLANVWLKQNGQQPTQWPEATLGNASLIRAEYLVAIRAADNGDLQLLIDLQGRYAGKSQSDKGFGR